MAFSQFASIRVAAAPVARSQADDLSNGQQAQKLNRQFQAITVQDSCTGGETACIAGNFATCSPENDWEVSPCPKSLECFAVPGVGKAGTSTLCTTQDDALARIKDTGATGGINGDDSSDDNSNNGGSSTSVATTTSTTSTDVSGTPTASSTVTSAPAFSDIPELSIPVGGDLSSILASTTTTASNEEITSTPNSTLSDTTTTLPKATPTPALSDIPAFSLPLGQDLTAVLPTQSISYTPGVTSSASTSTESGRSIIRLTTTVTVPPCTTTDAAETSAAQGSASPSHLLTFTTHPFSPIPVSTSASASDTLTSSTGGYLTVSTSSSSGSSVSQTTPPDAPATLSYYPSGAAPSSTTATVPTYSSEPSIPPLAPAAPTPTPPFNVLPIHSIPA